LSASVLETRNVVKRYGAKTVVDDASLIVDEGECLGVIGPNGAGKTTPFNVIDGATGCDGGLVMLGGEDITRLAPFRRARLGIGRAYQAPPPFAGLTVFENVLSVHRHPQRTREDLRHRHSHHRDRAPAEHGGDPCRRDGRRVSDHHVRRLGGAVPIPAPTDDAHDDGPSFSRRVDDYEIPETLGFNRRRVYNAAMGPAVAMSGVAGMRLAVRTTFMPLSGVERLLLAFKVVIIGGLGSLRGSFFAGLALGVVQIVELRFQPNSGPLFDHLAFFVVLLTRQGRFSLPRWGRRARKPGPSLALRSWRSSPPQLFRRSTGI